MQDQYYNVRGPAFIIPRVEEREIEQPGAVHRAKFVRNKRLPARQARPAPGPSSLSLIQQAMVQNPAGLMLVSDGPLVDVQVEEGGAAPGTAGADVGSPVTPAVAGADTFQPTTCTGIVRVPSSSDSNTQEADEDTFQTSSTSPRRTKMLRFTCLANGCRAVNVKPISPDSFASGTVFAQCAKCAKWHLIRDHLSLWDQSKRTVYRNGKRVVPVRLEDVPPSLRPLPEDLDFFANGGKVAGWEAAKAEGGEGQL
ncbi:hypothetical protein GPECTOR_4g828 [Gonium pectorale]|uniref:DNL-type domain-containing protein n=1 Tax=Gonium pectorale TaxID=33097 RepID=A0A150GYK0_GONPE|nr:hypothetical protein GPECTOR_4g828 [Gonium pectorale]|eukprot:KXZ54758.1 hypothetical protein GPECTOR_4g828 [Gonium pectorale]